jgi:hypothetical protein
LGALIFTYVTKQLALVISTGPRCSHCFQHCLPPAGVTTSWKFSLPCGALLILMLLTPMRSNGIALILQLLRQMCLLCHKMEIGCPKNQHLHVLSALINNGTSKELQWLGCKSPDVLKGVTPLHITTS